MHKLTKEQKQIYKQGIQELEDQVSVEESQEAIDLAKAKDAPEMMWACTPPFKLKANNPMVDIQLEPEMTKGGVIRIVRVGSNKLKICSMVRRDDVGDGYSEAVDSAKKAQKKARKNKNVPAKNAESK